MLRLDPLARLAPGLPALVNYRRDDFSHDLAAGVAVAAVAIPGSVANAQLAGFSPVVGLYASTLPMIAYALFGTSRQLMVGPSAASGAIVAAAVAPLAGGDDVTYLALATALTAIAGLLCVAASFLRLGAVADLLSKPILVGFMNGVAINVVLSQIGVLFGVRIDAGGILPRIWEFLRRLPETHLPTLVVGAVTVGVLLLAPRIVRRVPAALIAMVVAGALVQAFALEAAGVRTIGPVPSGFPVPAVPTIPLDLLPTLVAEAAGLALVLFSSSMLAARSFADRNGYEVDADREIAALGVANVAAAFVQSFAVQGTNSRTVVGEVAGGRTQVTGIVAAVVVAIVVALFTWPLQFIPRVALAAVLVITGGSLFNWRAVQAIWRIDRREFWITMTATVGVIVVGVMNAILLAVVLALVNFVQLAARPRVERLGTIAGEPGFHSVERHPEAVAPEGLVLFRFNGALIFFGAAYFKREVGKAVAGAGPGVRWFVLDLVPVTMIDATGLYAIREVFADLRARGIVVCFAGRATEWSDWAAARGLEQEFAQIRMFASVGQAASAYREEVLAAGEGGRVA